MLCWDIMNLPDNICMWLCVELGDMNFYNATEFDL